MWRFRNAWFGFWYGIRGHFSIKRGQLFVHQKLQGPTKHNVCVFNIRKRWRIV